MMLLTFALPIATTPADVQPAAPSLFAVLALLAGAVALLAGYGIIRSRNRPTPQNRRKVRVRRDRRPLRPGRGARPWRR
jgi:hypothetical protein